MDKKRQERIHLLVKGLNKSRHNQAKKIDMLCKDIIPAHGDFIEHLNSFRFAIDFYEAIIGVDGLERMLETAGDHICSEILNLNIAIILPNPKQLISYHSETSSIDFDIQELTSCFTNKLIKDICQSNMICTVDDMFKMGLAANLTMLKKISVAAIPLNRIGPSTGIILLCRSAQNPLRHAELAKIASIAIGLNKAIISCRNKTPKKSLELNI